MRFVTPSDFSDSGARKRLSDFKYLMKMIEAAAFEKGLNSSSNIPLQQSVAMYEECKQVIHIPTLTTKKRKKEVESVDTRYRIANI